MMKRRIFFILMLSTVSVFSAEATPDFQAMAEAKYKDKLSIEFKEGYPERRVTFNFDGPIDRIVVNAVDNPIRWFGFVSEGVGSSFMAVQRVVREIHLYSGQQYQNCYVVFESDPAKEIKVKELLECK